MLNQSYFFLLESNNHFKPKEYCMYSHTTKNVQQIVIYRKKPRLFSRGFMFALPIFPASHPASIVGANELNFCVRDGNRWTLMTINTNYKRWV